MVFAFNFKKKSMVKGCSFLLVGLLLLVSIPLCIGIAGGIFGLIFGIIGGIFGLIFGLMGGIFKAIAWAFGSMMHLIFGWHSDFGFHPWHWHFNGYFFAALIILIIALSQRKK